MTDPKTGEKVWHVVTLDRARDQQYFQICDQREWFMDLNGL